MADVYVMGDLHGYFDDYVRLLADGGLIDAANDWCGGDAQLWQIGDIFDRGTDGASCVELTMKLQAQAAAAGGHVNAVLGNHDMMVLCVDRFGDAATRDGGSVRSLWYRWGGVEGELDALTGEQIDWLRGLPLMALVGDRLLVHADSIHYIDHGRTIEEVNHSFAELLASDDLPRWEEALARFCEHETFSGFPVSGQVKAETMLRCYGGKVLVHGHTPITVATGRPAQKVTQAWSYADGACVNVDGGLYMGGPGFLYQFTLDT